jgi:hypothetical protein
LRALCKCSEVARPFVFVEYKTLCGYLRAVSQFREESLHGCSYRILCPPKARLLMSGLRLGNRHRSAGRTLVGKHRHLDNTWRKYSRVTISEKSQQPDKEDLMSCIHIRTRLGFDHLIPTGGTIIVDGNHVCICKSFSSLHVLEPVRR